MFLLEYALRSRDRGFTKNAEAIFHQVVTEYPESPEAAEAKRYLEAGPAVSETAPAVDR